MEVVCCYKKVSDEKLGSWTHLLTLEIDIGVKPN